MNVLVAIAKMFGFKGISFSLTKQFEWTGYQKEIKLPPIYRYFTPEEIGGLDETFVAKLDQARHIAGFPFVITSGFRTSSQNQSTPGAVADSAHLKGLAVDIRVSNSHEVSLLIDAAKQVGITRRGIYVNEAMEPVHVHVDVDPDKVSEVIFIKKEGQANSAAMVA